MKKIKPITHKVPDLHTYYLRPKRIFAIHWENIKCKYYAVNCHNKYHQTPIVHIIFQRNSDDKIIRKMNIPFNKKVNLTKDYCLRETVEKYLNDYYEYNKKELELL